jgi:addiction module RelE/StbE family toxin
MQIKWFSDALSDLIEIRNYIKLDKPQTAQDIAKRIIQTVDLLKDNPKMGRHGRIENTRELVISGTPYIIPYIIKEDIIIILRVLHGAMKWTKKF